MEFPESGNINDSSHNHKRDNHAYSSKDNLPASAVRTVVLVILSIAMLFTIPMILAASRYLDTEAILGLGFLLVSGPWSPRATHRSLSFDRHRE